MSVTAALPADNRWQHFVTRSPAGDFVPLDLGVLLSEVQALSGSVPVDTAEVVRSSLDRACRLLLSAWHHYELLPQSMAVAYQAIELQLRETLGARSSFEKLIDRAADVGFLGEVDRWRLHAVRRMRNELVHPTIGIVVLPGDAMRALRVAHDYVLRLCGEQRRELNV